MIHIWSTAISDHKVGQLLVCQSLSMINQFHISHWHGNIDHIGRKVCIDPRRRRCLWALCVFYPLIQGVDEKRVAYQPVVVDQRCQHQADHSPFASIQVGVVKVATMLPATTLKPTFTGPRLPVAKAGRVSVSRAALRVRAGPYDEELIATAVRRPGLSIDQDQPQGFL